LTVLCLIRDKLAGTWAAFADCLITSDEFDEGQALVTPNRLYQDERTTHGFAEVRLEEKLGLLNETCLFGWENSRQEASNLIREIRSVGVDTFDFSTLTGRSFENSFLIISRKPGSTESIIRLFSNHDRSSFFENDRFTVHASGSGKDLVDKLQFTSKGGGVQALTSQQDIAQAALTLLVKYLSEELGGRNSQYYSRRTGGWYSLFLPVQDGFFQYRFGFNHWALENQEQPVVTHIVLPWVQDGINCAVTFRVHDNWKLEYLYAIAVAPLLNSTERSRRLSIEPLDVLLNYESETTFHYCWKQESHGCFAVPISEPRFQFDGKLISKLPHAEHTYSLVSQFFER